MELFLDDRYHSRVQNSWNIMQRLKGSQQWLVFPCRICDLTLDARLEICMKRGNETYKSQFRVFLGNAVMRQGRQLIPMIETDNVSLSLIVTPFHVVVRFVLMAMPVYDTMGCLIGKTSWIECIR
jgi:hypothetical protein